MKSALLAILLVTSPDPGHLRSYDADYIEALELLYDGSTDTALARLSRLSELHPEDPAGPYFESLAWCWKIEQNPSNARDDSLLLKQIERGLKLSERLLQADPSDVRARLCRAGTFGVHSRFHLFRSHNREARRDAIKTRAELMLVRSLEPENREASFGLGLYDYYADILPRVLKLLRFLVGMPAGNKHRGLRLIESARNESDFHRTEAQVQLYEIYAFYEGQPDRAYHELRELHDRYPGAPLWGLKLAELLRDQLGLYQDSVRVSHEIIAAVKSAHPNFAPIVADMARLSMGEALMLDHRFTQARQTLEVIQTSFPDRPVLCSKTHMLLGRCLEIEGARAAAMEQYQQASRSPDENVRQTARKALSAPLRASEIEIAHLIGDARRLAENGRHQQSRALYRQVLALDSDQPEAALAIAEESLRTGPSDDARSAIERVCSKEHTMPPWLHAWARLLRGHVYDLAGERQLALQSYEEVVRSPYGRDDYRERALKARQTPYSPEQTPALDSDRPESQASRDNHSK